MCVWRVSDGCVEGSGEHGWVCVWRVSGEHVMGVCGG